MQVVDRIQTWPISFTAVTNDSPAIARHPSVVLMTSVDCDFHKKCPMWPPDLTPRNPTPRTHSRMVGEAKIVLKCLEWKNNEKHTKNHVEWTTAGFFQQNSSAKRWKCLYHSQQHGVGCIWPRLFLESTAQAACLTAVTGHLHVQDKITNLWSHDSHLFNILETFLFSVFECMFVIFQLQKKSCTFSKLWSWPC